MRWAVRFCLVSALQAGVVGSVAGPLRAEGKGVVSAQLLTYVAPVLPPAPPRPVPPFLDFLATLGADGKLHDPTPLVPGDEYTTAARDAAMQWVYMPYKRNGKPYDKNVYVRVLLPVHEHQVSYATPVRLSATFMPKLLEKPPLPVVSPAHMAGNAVLLGRIARDGSVENAKMMSGPPQFASPAVDSVHRWSYRPMLLDGVPVEVETPMRVDFTP